MVKGLNWINFTSSSSSSSSTLLCRKISLFKLFSLSSHHIFLPHSSFIFYTCTSYTYLTHIHFISHSTSSKKSLVFTVEVAASTRMTRGWRIRRRKKWNFWGNFAVIFRTDIEVGEWVRWRTRKAAAVQWTVNVWRKENCVSFKIYVAM